MVKVWVKARKIVSALTLCTLVAVSATICDAKEWKKLRIATEGAYPPWNATDPSGRLVGFEIDLAKHLCSRMGVNDCEIIPQDWEGMIPGLIQGKYDAIMATMSITDERERAIAFAGPYAAEPTVFAVLRTSPLAIASFAAERVDLTMSNPDGDAAIAIEQLAAALKGKVVGVQTATIQANFLEKFFPNVPSRSYDTMENAGLDLVSGRVDAILGPYSSMAAINKTKNGNELRLVGPAFSRGILGKGVGVGVRKTDTDLNALFSKAIEEANQDGTIAKLSVQHLEFDASVK